LKAGACARHQLAFAVAVGLAGALVLVAPAAPPGLALAGVALGLGSCQLVAGTGLALVSRRADLGHWAAACGVLGFAAASRVHVAFFGVGLDGDTLGLALDALRAREVVVPPRWLALAGLGGVLGGAACGLLLAACRRVFGAQPVPLPRVALGAALAGALALAEPLPADGPLRELVPWSAARADEFAAYAVRDARGDVVHLDPDESSRDSAALAREKERLLAGARIERPRDVVMIVLESFRWDLVSEEGTPYLARLGERCLHPELHYASGANTLAGLFGLLHGLSMFHFPGVKESLQQPLPLALLGRLGYERRLYRGFDLAYTELGERFFEGTIDRDVAEPGGDAVRADAALVEQLLRLRRAGAGPRFDLLVLYATHWGYVYPPAFERFLPVAPPDLPLGNATGASPLRAWAEGLKNRQRNAAAYLDSLLGPLLEQLAAEAEPPLVVVTGDHGEEFFERGRLGHTWDVNDEMVRVPLWICLPEPARTRYRYADHTDVFPTLFDALGVEPTGGAFLTGKSLLRYEPARDFALSGVPRRRARLRMAVAGDGLKVHFLPFGALQPTAILGLADQPLPEAPRERVVDLLRRAAEQRRIR